MYSVLLGFCILICTLMSICIWIQLILGTICFVSILGLICGIFAFLWYFILACYIVDERWSDG